MGDGVVTRRSAVLGAGGVAAVAAVAACGADEAEAPESGTALGSAGDIDVGGGRIFEDEQLVVTQPAEGEFKCFSAVCTHQQCVVKTVADEVITCDCHGSQFAIADGSVAAGPAEEPLPEYAISVDDTGELVVD